MKNKIVKEILSWILVIFCAVALATFINKFIILKVEVPTGSMEKTIMTGDRVITSRISYLFSEPKRGDIIVFPFPDDERIDYIKRIIGLPGETIEGRDGYVLINGEILNEKYVTSLLEGDFGPYEIPENSYFMMGDHREVSEDSRYWENKYVNKSNIIGKAILKYPDFHWLNQTPYK